MIYRKLHLHIMPYAQATSGLFGSFAYQFSCIKRGRLVGWQLSGAVTFIYSLAIYYVSKKSEVSMYE